jgi:pyruvate formate lyase activating enzyme
MGIIKNNKDNTNSKRGIVFNIERHALHDGPGIRTLVFLKGCPLGCYWCSNPEGLAEGRQLMFTKEKCLRCGQCAEICPNQAISRQSDEYPITDREECKACGECLLTCPANARHIVGKEMSAEEVLREVEKDMVFYRHSDGGITVSGGEPMRQHEFVAAVFRLCKSRGISTAIETSGFAPWEHFEVILPYTDLMLFDIKHMDTQKHKESVGVDNELILKNLSRIDGMGVSLIIRVPTIPGFNDTKDNMKRLAALAKTLQNVTEIHLLPFHSLGRSKYGGLDVCYRAAEVEPPSMESMQRLSSVFNEAGIKTAIEV